MLQKNTDTLILELDETEEVLSPHAHLVRDMLKVQRAHTEALQGEVSTTVVDQLVSDIPQAHTAEPIRAETPNIQNDIDNGDVIPFEQPG